jgi:hypothetical protein
MQSIVFFDIVMDDLAEPVPGELLSGLALEIVPSRFAQGAVHDLVVIDGTISWARFDSMSSVFEMVVDAEGFRLLTRVWNPANHEFPRVGGEVSVEGYLCGIREYEFEAFGLPQISQDWLVDSAAQLLEGKDYLLEVRVPDRGGTRNA